MPQSSRLAVAVPTALLTLITMLVAPHGTVAADESRTISGLVVDAADGRPVAAAVVHAATSTTSVRTGDDGRFTLPGVPATATGVVAARQGYSFRWHTLDSRDDTPVTIRLRRETPRTVPHPDYPRPDADRRPGTGGKWLSLNGTWSLGFDPQDVGLTRGWAAGHDWEHVARVPFSYTSLAGVGEEARAGNQVYASQFEAVRGVVWYQRDFTVPADWPGDRGVLLRFGAVEWNARVFLDGHQLVEHDGGYSPFDVDLGRLAPGSQHSLVVRAWVPDNGDRTPYPQGKQMGWYADTGGIWQSVWLEPADPARLTTVHVTPHVTFGADGPVARAEISVEATADGPIRLTIRDQAGRPGAPRTGTDLPRPVEPEPGRVVAQTTARVSDGRASTTVDLPDARLWSPETPWLYQLTAELTGWDAMATWFGVRSVRRGWAPGHSPAEQPDPRLQYQYVYLNDRPVYLRAALDQAFNPWGGYSYTGLHQGADLRSGSVAEPRKGSVLFDLALARQLGFNATRPHIKVNDPLYYHWADVLGLMVWYDQPNFGYHGYSPEAERLFEGVLRDAVRRDHNHPSIVVWDVFNEAWGIGVGIGGPIREDAKPWIERMVRLTGELVGDTRLVVDNSPCCENGHPSNDTDLLDFHGYLSTWDQWRDNVDRHVRETYPGSTFLMEEGGVQSGQPLLNSEFGPWSGGRERDQEVATPFRYTAELFRAQPKVNGYLFTELIDIEWEWNGWAAYDRTLQVPGYLDAGGRQGGVGLANGDDVLVFDARPLQRVVPGGALSLPVKSSLFSGRAADGSVLRWRVTGTDRTGAPITPTAWHQRAVAPVLHTTTDLGHVDVVVPRALVAGRLDVQLVRDREVLATGQTFLADWDADDTPAGTLRLDPGAAQADWPQGHGRFHDNAVRGHGDGAFTWRLPVPGSLRAGGWDRAQLVLEAAAARPELPRTRFPQTSERRYPTTLEAVVAGHHSPAVVLPDDPADARGALSHESGFDPGQYGYRVVLDLDADALRAAARDGTLTVTLRGTGGGLTVLGPRTGRFGISPQIVFSSGRGVPGPPVTPAEPYIGTVEGAGVTTYLVPGPLQAGRTTTVTATVVNDTPRPVRDVRPELVLPTGWRAEFSGPAPQSRLQPGEAAAQRYRVTPNAPGAAEVRTRAYYCAEDDDRRVTEEPWSLTVGPPEPDR